MYNRNEFIIVFIDVVIITLRRDANGSSRLAIILGCLVKSALELYYFRVATEELYPK